MNVAGIGDSPGLDQEKDKHFFVYQVPREKKPMMFAAHGVGEVSLAGEESAAREGFHCLASQSQRAGRTLPGTGPFPKDRNSLSKTAKRLLAIS